MSWQESLTGPHLDIAASDAPVNHILAGPGTGKTFSMMRRIRRWLESGVAPQRILAVTFTRTAALDLKDQLRQMGVTGAEEVHATTLHALAYSILSRQEVFEATGRSPRALFSYEERQLVLDLREAHGGIRSVKRLQLAFEAGWARLQRDPLGPPRDPSEAAFQAALLDWLRYHRAILVGELVPLALAYARRNPASNVLPAYAHVLVDEYQDLNRADQELVVAFPRSESLTVAGDPNQSIYRFRYAHPEGIIAFPGEHPDCAQFTLNVCQRCPANLVRMATSLVDHNPPWARPINFQPPTDRQDARVYVVQHRTTDEEIRTIADFVHEYLRAHPDTPAGRVLILATRRFLGNGIKDALIARGRNALSFFFEDELKEQAAAEGLCLLNLLVAPDDRAALRAWLGLRRPDDGAAAPYRRIRRYSEQNEVDLRAVLDSMADGELVLPYCGSAVERYQSLRKRLAKLEGTTGLPLVDALWPASEVGVSNIRVLAANIAVENPDPAALLEGLRHNIMQPELPGSDGDVIRVMSLHKSKGLTADVCIVTGCVAGALPTIIEEDAASEDAARYEQRRLLYVAITRAQRVLVLSSAGLIERQLARRSMIDTFGFRDGYAVMQPSPFLDELGPACPTPMSSEEWRDAVQFGRFDEE